MSHGNISLRATSPVFASTLLIGSFSKNAEIYRIFPLEAADH